jgi:hypothetical protein
VKSLHLGWPTVAAICLAISGIDANSAIVGLIMCAIWLAILYFDFIIAALY